MRQRCNEKEKYRVNHLFRDTSILFMLRLLATLSPKLILSNLKYLANCGLSKLFDSKHK
jgi:hypothetical protein